MPAPTPTTTSRRRPTRRTQAERREQTRAKLLDATIQSVLDVGYAGTTTRRVAELRELAGDLPAEPSRRVSALLDLIWADFSSPIFTVFVKLWVAAADDQELYARLVPVERQLARAIAAAAEDFGGELVDRPEWTGSLLLALSAIRGLALGARFEPHGQRRRDPWPDLRAALLRAFERI